MHHALKRSLLKLGFNQDRMPQSIDQWQNLIESISVSFAQFDEDREKLKQSLADATAEMQKEIRHNQIMSLQLAQAGKMASLGTLASGVAHELNNPLAVILGFSEMLQSSPNLNDKEKNMIQRINSVSYRMAGTVRHLLKLSRQGDGDKEELLEIRKPIVESLELLRSQFEIDNVRIKLNFLDENIFIRGNENALIGVFQNLLTNSRDAFVTNAKPGQTKFIEFKIKKIEAKNMILVSYTDNAGGIPLSVMSKIFDPFFTTKDVGTGTGLGLSISKQVIEEHHGKINVTTVEGLSSTFEISFPIATESECQYQETTQFTEVCKVPKGDVKREISNKKILVIDDEKDICNYLQDLLSEQFNVTATSSSQNALQLISNERFDLIITDLKMPIVSGEQIAKHLRKTQPNALLMFMSGHADGNLDGSLDAFQPFVLIEKPFLESSLLIEMVSDCILAKPMTELLFRQSA